MVYVLHSWRYGSQTTSDHDTLEDAVSRAFWEVEDNYAAPDHIVCPDGRVIRRSMRVGDDGEMDRLMRACRDSHPWA